MFEEKPVTNYKPVLRWAGGKSWVLPVVNQLVKIIAKDGAITGNYHEPFFGGGAVFFYLKAKNYLMGKSYLSDLNDELVVSYKFLKRNPDELLHELYKLSNDKDTYYQVRSSKPSTSLGVATRFFYLNRTSFNGIYRVNLKNEYNVPYGNKKYKILFEEKRYYDVSELLQRTFLSKGDFSKILSKLSKNDLVFLDPPYTVAHENNGFVKYNQNIFSWEDQVRLRDLCFEISRIGAYFILTNASHSSIDELYEKCGRRMLLQRPSVIGGKKAKRGTINELLFTNIPKK
ncbi:MAG TPA: Dam family site-specific DNA-(adenine-N6)-methyltransferase [Bacteroidales bacterium]|nr:Dam family site-specific DNA-(adenine-N6)-methyltransferase [Bacteroidales bacterium]